MMKKNIVAGCLLLAALYLAGCGLKTEVSRYFYSPAWVRDGKIIFIAESYTVDKDALGSQLGSSYTQYVSTIYPTGTGESAALFETTDEPPYALSCSPTEDYVAYMKDLRSGLFGAIVIRNIAAGPYTGMEMTEIKFSPGIKAFDWSSSGNRLVYCTSTEVRVINIDGTNDTPVVTDSNIEFVSWQYGNQIAFVRASGSDKLLSLINPNSFVRVDLPAGASVDFPQIASADTNIVYGVVSGGLYRVDVNAKTRAPVIASGFKGALPRLSPDAAMLAYSKTDQQSGVYAYNLATSAETTVK